MSSLAPVLAPCVWGGAGQGGGGAPSLHPPSLPFSAEAPHAHLHTPGLCCMPGTGLVATSSCLGPQSQRFHGGKQPHCGGANQPTPVPSRLPSWPRWPVAPCGWLPGRLSSLVTSNEHRRKSKTPSGSDSEHLHQLLISTFQQWR